MSTDVETMIDATRPVERRGQRDLIEQLLADGSVDAVPHLASYWRGHKTPAAAHFVVSGFERLLPQLQMTRCRLAILRSFTVEPLIPLLKAASFSGGICLETRLSDFNAYAQEILDPDSNLYKFQPNVVVLAVETRDVAPQLWHSWSAMTSEQRAVQVQEVVKRFADWIEVFRTHSQANLIVHNLQTPPVATRGVLDAQAGESQQDAIVDINRQLRRLAAEHAGVYMLDYDALVARHGRSSWSDDSKRLSMSLPIAGRNLIHLCEEWTRFLHPISGRVAKAIVVDLDNTLWGGILGENGRDGIQIGADYPGSIYREVQQTLLNLRDRGILLAISSKNDETEALDVLARHAGMLLRPDHFSAFRIGWKEKSDSLREIAEELNIGLDALAFLDDNPVERHRIATDLPEVRVIDLPDDPIGFVAAIRECPLFERLTISQEDLDRGQYYSDQRRRDELQRRSRTPDEFFRSLQQVAEITPLSASNRQRIAQLTQKTNQFNLTTRRYTEQEIDALAGSGEADVFAMRVTDTYNDNGIVGAAILRTHGRQCDVDTFLLSCRVIGRTVETAFLSFLCDRARSRGAETMRGFFVPTRKNAPARDFYLRHGFTAVEETDTGSSYEFNLLAGHIECPDWIQVI